MTKPLAAEFLGTLLLLSTVVGSGIMGESLASGNTAVALMVNALSTGAMLYVLISVFGPLSGAHFNPVVTLAMWATRRIGAKESVAYISVQILGAIAGVFLAHQMFDQTLLQVATKQRWGEGQWWSEWIATFGLVFTILALLKQKSMSIATAVALYIVAAYFFTASTSFANPAVTLARCLTNTFAGISPSSVFAFIVAQCLGAGAAIVVAQMLFGKVET